MRDDVLAKVEADPGGVPARILDAAEEVLAERGFAGTTTREVAKRAAVPLGAVHYYWGSKEGLRETVLARLVSGFAQTLSRNLPEHGRSDPLEGLVDAFFDLLSSNRNAARLLVREMLEPTDRELQRAFRELVEAGLRSMPGASEDADPRDVLRVAVLAGAFLSAVANEAGQEMAMGASVFDSAEARERLRAELRRLAAFLLGA